MIPASGPRSQTSEHPVTPVRLAAYEAGRSDAGFESWVESVAALRTTRHGNIATEDLVFALERLWCETGLDLDALIAASDWLGEQPGRPTPGLVAKAGPFPA